MPLSRKPKSPSRVTAPKDCLTFSAWPPKVMGTGAGVRPAFYLALAVVALLAIAVVASAVKPATSPGLLATALSSLASKAP